MGLTAALDVALNYPDVIATQEEKRLMREKQVEWRGQKRGVNGKARAQKTMWGQSILSGKAGPCVLFCELERSVRGLPPLIVSNNLEGQAWFNAHDPAH